MRYDCGRIVLDVPDELQDRTLYAFEQPEVDPDAGIPPEKVVVMFEPLPAQVTPQDMIANIQQKMEQFPDFAASYRQGQARAGGHAARTLTVDPTGGGARILIAAFRLPGVLMATIRFETSRKDASAVFDPMLESVRGIDTRRKPAPGHAQRRAGRMLLDLPAELSPPEAYRFMTEDERLRLMIFDESDDLGVEADFDDWMGVGGGERIEVEKIHFDERVLDDRPVEEGIWRADRRDDQGDLMESKWLRVLRIRFDDGRAVRVLLIEAGNPDLGDACWPGIVASVQIAGED